MLRPQKGLFHSGCPTQDSDDFSTICIGHLFSLRICRCLRSLPEAQANEVALQLAGLPHLASGSSQELLLSFLRERATSLSAVQRSTFDSVTLSLHVPQPWRERLSHLLGAWPARQ